MLTPPSDRLPTDDWQTVRHLGHDLNNLLGAIAGYSEILVEDTPPDWVFAADLRRILESAQRATELVAALMAHARASQARAAGPSQPR